MLTTLNIAMPITLNEYAKSVNLKESMSIEALRKKTSLK